MDWTKHRTACAAAAALAPSNAAAGVPLVSAASERASTAEAKSGDYLWPTVVSFLDWWDVMAIWPRVSHAWQKRAAKCLALQRHLHLDATQSAVQARLERLWTTATDDSNAALHTCLQRLLAYNPRWHVTVAWTQPARGLLDGLPFWLRALMSCAAPTRLCSLDIHMPHDLMRWLFSDRLLHDVLGLVPHNFTVEYAALTHFCVRNELETIAWDRRETDKRAVLRLLGLRSHRLLDAALHLASGLELLSHVTDCVLHLECRHDAPYFQSLWQSLPALKRCVTNAADAWPGRPTSVSMRVLAGPDEWLREAATRDVDVADEKRSRQQQPLLLLGDYAPVTLLERCTWWLRSRYANVLEKAMPPQVWDGLARPALELLLVGMHKPSGLAPPLLRFPAELVEAWNEECGTALLTLALAAAEQLVDATPIEARPSRKVVVVSADSNSMATLLGLYAIMFRGCLPAEKRIGETFSRMHLTSADDATGADIDAAAVVLVWNAASLSRTAAAVILHGRERCVRILA